MVKPTLHKLGLLLLVAVLASSLNANASAAVWKDKGVAINGLAEFKMLGGEFFETSPGNGMFCGVEATIRMQNSTTSEVPVYVWDGDPCSGSGTFAKCELSAFAMASNPWAITLNAAGFTAPMKIVRGFHNCPVKTLTSTVTASVWTPDNLAEIHSFEVEGSGTPTGYRSGSSLEVISPNIGLYGIG